MTPADNETLALETAHYDLCAAMLTRPLSAAEWKALRELERQIAKKEAR